MTTEQSVAEFLSTSAQVSAGILAVVFAFQVAFPPQYWRRAWVVLTAIATRVPRDPQKSWQEEFHTAMAIGNRRAAEATISRFWRTLPGDQEHALRPMMGELAAIEVDRRRTSHFLLAIGLMGFLAVLMNLVLLPFSGEIAAEPNVVLLGFGTVTALLWLAQAIVFYGYMRRA